MRVNIFCVVWPAASVALSVKVNGPLAVAVPEIVPEGASVKPVGKLPEASWKV